MISDFTIKPATCRLSEWTNQTEVYTPLNNCFEYVGFQNTRVYKMETPFDGLNDIAKQVVGFTTDMLIQLTYGVAREKKFLVKR